MCVYIYIFIFIDFLYLHIYIYVYMYIFVFLLMFHVHICTCHLCTDTLVGVLGFTLAELLRLSSLSTGFMCVCGLAYSPCKRRCTGFAIIMSFGFPLRVLLRASRPAILPCFAVREGGLSLLLPFLLSLSLSLSLCICLYIYIQMYIYIYTKIYTNIYVYVYVCI